MERFQMIAEAHLLLFRRNEADGGVHDEVLLLQRFNTGWEDGKYSVVAGHVDGGETIREAMVREALEEVGIVLAPDDLRFVEIMHRNSDTERLSFFFTASHWQGEPSNREPDKCSEVAWFRRDALPQPMVAYVRDAIERCGSGKGYSEFGWQA